MDLSNVFYQTAHYDEPDEAYKIVEEYKARENLSSYLIAETVKNTDNAEMLRKRLDALDAQYDNDRSSEWDFGSSIVRRRGERGRRVYTGQTEQPGCDPEFAPRTL